MKPDYESLSPGGLRGWLRRNRLYLAADHLLLVRFDGFTEEYRRFHLRDIQGFVVRRTTRRAWVNLILGGLALLLLLPVPFPDTPFGAQVTFGVLAAIPLVGVLINSSAGPTCRTSIRTAVQTLDVPALSRERDYDRVLARITPLVLAAQGAFADSAPPTMDRSEGPAPAEEATTDLPSPPADS